MLKNVYFLRNLIICTHRNSRNVLLMTEVMRGNHIQRGSAATPEIINGLYSRNMKKTGKQLKENMIP